MYFCEDKQKVVRLFAYHSLRTAAVTRLFKAVLNARACICNSFFTVSIIT